MSRPDEGLIHMWLDGECSAEEAARIERLVATDAEWAAAVAEARGLIAASSRIVSALDAVPARVMPAGSKAAPELGASSAATSREGFRVRQWMKMAAGVVLVAGTAFVIRESTRDAFGPSAAVETDAEAVAPAVVHTPEPARTSESAVSDTVVANATPVRAKVAAKLGATASGAVTADAPPIGPPAVEAPAPVAGTAAAPATGAPAAPAAPTASAAEDRARRFAEVQRRFESGALSQVVTTGTRGAEPEKMLPSPNSLAPLTRLDGCWNITAPDSLRTLLRSPSYVRGTADTLVLEFVLRETHQVSVVRNDGTLRGAITAKRVECPKP